MNYYPFPTR